ncbi:LCP family protein [Propionibacterium sp.]|uniref:LCP family protein n=1 Tax=Propionibacterium sp. TaxID=1977903 RepID=UPI0039ED454E
MADPRDEESRREDLDWLYHHGEGADAARQPDQGRVTNISNTADIERREREYLAQKAARQHRQDRLRAAQSHPGGQPPPHPPPRPLADSRASQTPKSYSRPHPAPAGPRFPPSAPAAAGPLPPSVRVPPKRRHPVRRTLVALLVLLLCWAVYIVAVPIKAWSDMPQVDWAPAGTRPGNQPGTAILLVGSDSRSDLTQAQKDELGTGDADGGRTDTIMILYVPPSGKSVLISVPRDSYVNIPGYGKDKINAAFSYGGPQLLVQTVENYSGLRIDGYMEIGFDGFANVVDAVNGINVCLDAPMDDEKANINLPAGCQTLNGDNALGYVRHRYGDPEGDLGRAKRQREVVSKVAAKLKKPSTVLNPVRWWNVNKALSGSFTRGKDTGPGVLIATVRGMLSVSSGGGYTVQVPVADPAGWSDDGTQSVVLLDTAKSEAMFGSLEKGDTSTMGQYTS